MTRRNYRGGRIGEEIKRIISEMLLRELKDPAFSGFVSVTDVRAADDGSYATVYITMLGSDPNAETAAEERKEVMRAFERAKGLIRREIGARIQLRRTPELRFLFDTSSEYGRHIEELIGSLDISDASEESNEIPEDEPLAETDVDERRKNIAVPDLAEILTKADVVLLFTHENMDGDTLGSAVALCLALRSLGKESFAVVDEKIPDNILFIENGCVREISELETTFLSEKTPYLAIMSDVGETERLGRRASLFRNAEKTVCIDHHVSSKAVCDYNLIDAKAAASAEIVFELIEALGVPADARIAEAIYVGLVTDTGRFQYANTTEKTHLIAATLLRRGVSPAKVSVEIYQNFRPEKLYLENAVMGTFRTVANGKGVVAYMTREMLAQTGAMDEETEGIAEKLRAIRGVEVSVFLRETDDGKTKGSMRAKSYYDAAALAERFGGGGHIRAAGFSSERPLAELTAEITRILSDTLR
ncbi:MAG: 30S ribosome-binding factor RbfA [Clostridiales Family XIII bacterium]|jgi:phosphoesterase RecJ-like protein|nr:30S ribosome-binding factor RbfA [Clostridiales Family XIII bacterium]